MGARSVDPLRFPGWELHIRDRRLVVDGRDGDLGDRALDLLIFLAMRPLVVHSHDEILAGWKSSRMPTPAAVRAQVSKIRDVLPGVIETRSGEGYRLTVVPLHTAPGEEGRGVPLIGRDMEMRLLPRRLRESAHVVSVVGPGGVGKTALVRQFILGIDPNQWAHGVHWIDLALVGGGVTGLLDRVCHALDLRPAPDGSRDNAVRALASVEALVVLDGAEDVLETVRSVIRRVGEGGGEIRWLVTSRESLALSTEVVLPLDVLPLPEASDTPAQQRENPAVRLFAARLQQADPTAVIADEDLDAVVEICRRVDGLPLGVQIAAAWVPSLSLATIRDRLLTEHSPLPNPAKDAPASHASLQRLVNSSMERLDPAARDVLRQLAVFEGGFTVDHAVEVLRSSVGSRLGRPEIENTLGGLVRRSMLQRNAAGGRYRFLNVIRAIVRHASSDDDEALHERHARRLARLFDQAAADFAGMTDREWSARYLPERADLVAAMRWAAGTRFHDLFARLMGAVAHLELATHTGPTLLSEQLPLEKLDRLPSASGVEQATPEARARALMEYGWAHYRDGVDRTQAITLITRALEEYEAIGDRCGCYLGLSRLIRLHEAQGRHEQCALFERRLAAIPESAVRRRYRLAGRITAQRQSRDRDVGELRALVRQTADAGFDGLHAVALLHLTDQHLVDGDFELAVTEVLTALRIDGLPGRYVAMLNHNLSVALARLGRTIEARKHVGEVLDRLPQAAFLAACVLAHVHLRERDLPTAALVYGFGRHLRLARRLRPDRAEARMIRDTIAGLRQGMRPRQRRLVVADGRDMTARELRVLCERTRADPDRGRDAPGAPHDTPRGPLSGPPRASPSAARSGPAT